MQLITMPVCLKSDDWLSGILGKPAYGLEVSQDSKPCPADIQAALETANPNAFFYSKIAAGDIQQAHDLEETGFRLADVALTLEKHNDQTSPHCQGIRWADQNDYERVVEVAKTSFSYSRFHQDPLMPAEVADRIKAYWAANYFVGKRGDAMVVAPHNGIVAGFLQLLHAGDTLVIDLIAVDRNARRQGLAAAMIRFAQNELPRFARLRVGTQTGNIPSLRLYSSLGFDIHDAHFVFHLHCQNQKCQKGDHR